jgi:valyl-tRNA synthetase
MVCKLLASANTTKEEIGREKFDELIWKFKNEKSKTITDQIKKLGCACDWSREQFTLSDKLSGWVNRIFKSLFEKGMIYRGSYIINYCTCFAQTPSSLRYASGE